MTDDRDLSSLVEEVRSGSTAAFAQLVVRVQSRVRVWAARFTDDPDVADDIAQDVLIGLQRSVHQYHGRSRFSTWLYAVTRNTAREQRRLDERRSALRDEHVAPHIVATTRESDGTQDERTVAALILRYFDALPPKQRLIFELVDLRGHEPAEVARQLGMNQATVRAHLYKARRSIRARMLELHTPLILEFFS
jgi:RNA polymerase sigma-70 factor (ECF subfamily)